MDYAIAVLLITTSVITKFHENTEPAIYILGYGFPIFDQANIIQFCIDQLVDACPLLKKLKCF